MLVEILDAKTTFLILHLLGVALGAGGAYASDLIFARSVTDKRITKTEFGFLKLGSALVWIGLLVLIASGVGLFSLDHERYLASSKFLAKMTIVFIIVINGIIFHVIHIPLIGRHLNSPLSASYEFMRKRTILLFSGAISFISWTFTIILGALKSVPYPYTVIIIFYGVCLVGGLIVAYAARDRILHVHRKKHNEKSRDF